MSNIDERIKTIKTGFEFVNPEAEVVIVDITPGNSQVKGEREGLSPEEIKRTYAFKGGIRRNIVKMLDYIGVNTMLGIKITAPVVAIAHPSGNNAMRVLYYMGHLDSSLVWCKERAKEAKDTIAAIK